MANYAITHNGKVFTPDGKGTALLPPNAVVDEHNKAIEASELAEWANKPDRAVAYVSGGNITTWLGTKMGYVVRSNTVRNNFGARITYIRAQGSNGAMYYGKYGADWSQLVRLRKIAMK